MKQITFDRLLRKKRKVRSKMEGSANRPRISINRSNKYIYAQAIDDDKRITIASFSSLQLVKKGKEKINKSQQALLVGKELGKLLKEKKVLKAIFDRNQYIYMGRVKKIAEGLREGGLII
ncbi:50S ribosomal protein L18 [Candidatus Roizmanbacteria bacterium CG_4_10_14_0_8_um_filter_33_9]|uniref:Large ribosomal subunit protein uL18 n=1 Tax=Candidatus Roizmanbacteria bacterium CG_4_10_14_0_8_um_filter_33_9 TaxID=1974826 RepID=A0A2M7QJG5_9BACT|nr:MAG: 50S ribosomal protein L18 [Candidatus Roizmanbacteria bacterium CG_4_10_14_0_8_um_filter_33_9]